MTMKKINLAIANVVDIHNFFQGGEEEEKEEIKITKEEAEQYKKILGVDNGNRQSEY